MKCLNSHCEADVESDDNFCWKCGHWTAKGYSFFQGQNHVEIMNGELMKQRNRFFLLSWLFVLGFILFLLIVLFRGGNLFKPIFFLKRQVDGYAYGYHTAMIETNHIYHQFEVSTLEDAYALIHKDLSGQSWKCSHDLETLRLEADLEHDYAISSVNFCDISYEEAEKIKQVVDKMYDLFPNMKGALTNISITNVPTHSEYIASFQPSYLFVNPDEDISQYNQVNKTQILLNSYYFLNEDILSQPVTSVVGKNWYVKDATWESMIAHEFGHYLSFKIWLKENELEHVTFVTPSNYLVIQQVLNEFDDGIFSHSLLNEALDNYNQKYQTEWDLFTFASSISQYAAVRNRDGNFIADETIAEAIHDYYLHGNQCTLASYEIVRLIQEKL